MARASMEQVVNTTEVRQWTSSTALLKCEERFIISSEGKKFLNTHASNPLEFLDSIIAIRAPMPMHLSTHLCTTSKEPRIRTS